MEGIAPEDVHWRWVARIVLLSCLGLLVFAVHTAWKMRRVGEDKV
jgi:hypothetical protein